MTDSPKLQILGNGAIGNLLAAGALSHNINMRLCPRAALSTSGQVIRQSETISLPLPCYQPFNALAVNDILMVPLKVHDIRAALTSLPFSLDAGTAVVLLHNGMGGWEQARDVLPHNPLYLATTSHGALKESPETVRHTGFGQTMLGAAPDNASLDNKRDTTVKSLLDSCLPPVIWQDNIVEALWLKLAVNAVINPLTAIHNVRNGVLLEETYKQIVAAICAEVSLVMKAWGFEHSKEELEQRVRQVMHNTSANYSSMHQDVYHGRATEIQAINGYLLKMGEKKGIALPVNASLISQIPA